MRGGKWWDLERLGRFGLEFLGRFLGGGGLRLEQGVAGGWGASLRHGGVRECCFLLSVGCNFVVPFREPKQPNISLSSLFSPGKAKKTKVRSLARSAQ